MKNTKVKIVSEATMKKNAKDVRDAAWQFKNTARDSLKELFLNSARNYLKATLALMGVEGQVRVNKGGPAVSGEVTLHTEKVYCQFSINFFGGQYFYRTCKGRNDYIGGPNHWGSYAVLVEDPKRLALVLNQMSL